MWFHQMFISLSHHRLCQSLHWFCTTELESTVSHSEFWKCFVFFLQYLFKIWKGTEILKGTELLKLAGKICKYANIETCRENMLIWKLAGKICKYANIKSCRENMTILKLAGKICGLFFPHLYFSSGLPSPSPPSSGQVSPMKMLLMALHKRMQNGCICVAFLLCVLSNEYSNVRMLLMTVHAREWNWTKNGSLTIQSLNCLCSHWSSKLCKRCVRNSKIWSRMPLRSDLLHRAKPPPCTIQGPVSAKLRWWGWLQVSSCEQLIILVFVGALNIFGHFDICHLMIKHILSWAKLLLCCYYCVAITVLQPIFGFSALYALLLSLFGSIIALSTQMSLTFAIYDLLSFGFAHILFIFGQIHILFYWSKSHSWRLHK